MKPTNKLRFVERIEHGYDLEITKVKILQQWWEHKSIMDMKDGVWGEWRDVPVEVEE